MGRFRRLTTRSESGEGGVDLEALWHRGKSDRCFWAAAVFIVFFGWNHINQTGSFHPVRLIFFCLRSGMLGNNSCPCCGAVMLPRAASLDLSVNLWKKYGCYFQNQLIYWLCFPSNSPWRRPWMFCFVQTMIQSQSSQFRSWNQRIICIFCGCLKQLISCKLLINLMPVE